MSGVATLQLPTVGWTHRSGGPGFGELPPAPQTDASPLFLNKLALGGGPPLFPVMCAFLCH